MQHNQLHYIIIINIHFSKNIKPTCVIPLYEVTVKSQQSLLVFTYVELTEEETNYIGFV